MKFTSSDKLMGWAFVVLALIVLAIYDLTGWHNDWIRDLSYFTAGFGICMTKIGDS